MGREHKSAEAASLRLHALDLRDGILRRTDDPVAPIGARARGDFVSRLPGISFVRRFQSDRKKIVLVAVNTRFDVAPRFFPAVS